MTSRERLISTLDHREPDKVPVDLGATPVSGIAASTLAKLRKRLGLKENTVKVHEPFQLLGEVETDVMETLKVDVAGIWGPFTNFGYKNEEWKPWKLFDGTNVYIGGGFETTEDNEGNIFLYPCGDKSVPPSGLLPKGGYYFDLINRSNSTVDDEDLNGRKDFKDDFILYTEEDCKYFENVAAELYYNTNYGIIINFFNGGLGDAGGLPGPAVKHVKGIRDTQEWYIAHLTRPDYIREIFDFQTEIVIGKFKQLKQAIGDKAQAIIISATDFGTQRGEFISPDMYRELYKPYHIKMNEWIHNNTTWKTFYHTCGSIVRLLDDFSDAGIDILNPLQCSAEGMDPQMLKQKYGDKFVFWGGAINTQHTLPFGTPDEVKEETLKRLQIFAPGGGFVFAPIHNIQQNTPVENIVALFNAVNEYNYK
jgi:hypothetical protein